MAIDHKRKIIFIHVPKNAGTSIIECFGIQNPGHQHVSYYKNKIIGKWDDYKKICILRDPVERFLSCYRYARMDRSYWHGKNTRGGKHPDYDLCMAYSVDQVVDILYENIDQMHVHEHCYRAKRSLMHLGFKTQQCWISGSESDMIYLSMGNFMNYFSKNYNMNIEYINKSTGTLDVGLSSDSVDKIKRIYSVDYVLIQR